MKWSIEALLFTCIFSHHFSRIDYINQPDLKVTRIKPHGHMQGLVSYICITATYYTLPINVLGHRFMDPLKFVEH